MRVVGLGLLFLAAMCIPVLAEENSEQHEKQALITLSAFECSAVAPSEAEAERLFKVGYKAGHAFIEYAQKNQGSYNKLIRPKVSILWNTTTGPTPDFVLGQIYSFMVDKVYESYVADERLWRIKQQTMYREKNCALIGK